MTGTTQTSAGLDVRRKRLLFQCWHRGTREMDLILGRFADEHLRGMSDREVNELEQLLDMTDADLYAALTAPEGSGAPASGVFHRIRAFRIARD